jgi:hypothetical protein
MLSMSMSLTHLLQRPVMMSGVSHGVSGVSHGGLQIPTIMSRWWVI